MVHASFVGSCSSISYLSRSYLGMTASPLLHPLELEKTGPHTHVHTLRSHGRYVSISFPIFRCIKTDVVRC